MRFKITLEIDAEKYGNVLPISYQYELTSAVNNLLMADKVLFENWLSQNRFSLNDHLQTRLFAISNLYVPKIFVTGDRLHVNVPRIQFWISLLPSIGTTKFLNTSLLNKEIVLGDRISSVSFEVSSLEEVSPVNFYGEMEYQTLSPLAVIGVRPNNTVEYLNPRNMYFGQFMVEELIERWEKLYRHQYVGDRSYTMRLLQPERRKAVTVYTGTSQQQKVVGYMMKFCLSMAPELQELAYTLGLGDKINLGFGYIELLKKESH